MELTDEQLDRYARHIILKEVGGSGQKKLLAAKVLVVGAGGLGAPVLMYLAAAGVGTLGIVDDDDVALSNLQRQIIHDTDAVGTAKTESARAAIARINPDVRVILHHQRLDDTNAAEIIDEYDVVADGCDNFKTRLTVNAACIKTKTPLVSAALSQFDGQLATFRPFEQSEDGEALPCYQCLVPELPEDEERGTCAEQGVLGVVAGILGTMQAGEVIKEILTIGTSLKGKLLLYDALDVRSRIIKLPRDPACKACGDS